MKKFFTCLLVLLALLVSVLGIISGYHTGKQSGYPVAYSEYITKYARENKLDPCLVMAVI